MHISWIILYNCYSVKCTCRCIYTEPLFYPLSFQVFFSLKPLTNSNHYSIYARWFSVQCSLAGFVSIYLRLFPEVIIICDLRPIFQQHNLSLNKVLVCIYIHIYLFVLVHAYVPILYGERRKNIHTFYLIQRIIYS